MGMVPISYFGVPATTMPNLDRRAKPATTNATPPEIHVIAGLLAPRVLCSTSFAELKFAHHLLAHHELLGLAGRRHREFGNEADVSRNFEMSDFALAESAKFVHGRCLSRLENDECADLLAEALIRNPEDLHRLHLGMLD